MNIAGLRKSIKEVSFYIPFTLYFVLLAVAGALCWVLLNSATYQPETSFADIFLLLVKVASTFAIILIAFALLSVLFAWLFFLYYKKKRAINFQLTTDLKESDISQKQTVRLLIKPILKPLFGFLKIRLLYDDDRYSNKFSLVEKSRKTLFATSIDGVYHWPLPEIKEYHVKKAILYFEDFFQFFSIATNVMTSNNFFTHPLANKVNALHVFPRKTEETSTRIEELRRVEGEYLNYKNFEDNDDVRRIVWKIYAKNKELVVRVPEVMDPYASHVYLYASFFTSFNVEGNSIVEIPFLNYLKVQAWTIYQDLVKQGFDVKYIADQEVSKKPAGDEQQAVKYSISTSRWHQNKDLRNYVNTRDAAIILISSLSDAEQLAELVERFGGDIRFVFVKLSDSLQKQNALDWMQWLFVRHQTGDLENYKRIWSLSTMRNKILQNEKSIEAVLNKNSVVV